MTQLITKAGGNTQPFSKAKLMRSLRRAGATRQMAETVWERLEPQLQHIFSSQHLQTLAFRYLKKMRRVVAARYQLKKAIMELGPSGYPFERLIGELFAAQGFQVQVGQTLQGRCVQHEVDVVGQRESMLLLVECKYRNTPGYKCDVKVPLYIQSRFEDIRLHPDREPLEQAGWIATNTRFSSDAIQYAACVGLRLLGWDYPENKGLEHYLDTLRLYPLTVLTQLSKAQKHYLLEQKMVLCQDLLANPDLLRYLPGRQSSALPSRILEECKQVLHA